MYRKVPVIVNPAAGPDRPVLAVLNRAFQPAGIEWDILLTKGAGDAQRFAAEAAAAGVDAVAVYGGDGTVMEAVNGLDGSAVPLAILPGGTANVIAVELGIPADLAAACNLLVGDASTVRLLDVGEVSERRFLIRVGMGFEAQMIEGADRESKDRMGTLAYMLSALQALRDPHIARYHLTVDGRSFECEGITCIIANAGSFGQVPLKIAPTIDVGDGLLDVVVVTKADLGALLSVAASIVAGNEDAEALNHWQGREVTVVADPPQSVQVDGEMMGETPITARIVPQAVRVIVPRVSTVV